MDNFQSYIVELIRLVLHAKPSMLSTKKQSITLEDLLKYKSIDEIVHTIIEKRVNTATYEGFLELNKWCNS